MSVSLPALVLDAVVGVGLLLLMNSFAPLQWPTVAVYAGGCLVLAGCVSLIWPLRLFAIQTRLVALAVVGCGMVAGACGLFWPVATTHLANRTTQLDSVLPEYEFWEHHEIDVAAPADQTRRALEETSFDDVRFFELLMRIRTGFKHRSGSTQASILKTMSGPGSAFLPLTRSDDEIVLGMAGKPWASAPAMNLRTADDYRAYQNPGSVKIAFNLLIQEVDAGHSRLITDTRVKGLDDSARRTMARYWRVIYPGSALIRKMWLDAVRRRAEAPPPPSVRV